MEGYSAPSLGIFDRFKRGYAAAYEDTRLMGPKEAIARLFAECVKLQDRKNPISVLITVKDIENNKRDGRVIRRIRGYNELLAILTAEKGLCMRKTTLDALKPIVKYCRQVHKKSYKCDPPEDTKSCMEFARGDPKSRTVPIVEFVYQAIARFRMLEELAGSYDELQTRIDTLQNFVRLEEKPCSLVAEGDQTDLNEQLEREKILREDLADEFQRTKVAVAQLMAEKIRTIKKLEQQIEQLECAPQVDLRTIERQKRRWQGQMNDLRKENKRLDKLREQLCQQNGFLTNKLLETQKQLGMARSKDKEVVVVEQGSVKDLKEQLRAAKQANRELQETVDGYEQEEHEQVQVFTILCQKNIVIEEKEEEIYRLKGILGGIRNLVVGIDSQCVEAGLYDKGTVAIHDDPEQIIEALGPMISTLGTLAAQTLTRSRGD